MVIRLIAMGVAALATAMSVPTPAQTPTVESVPTPTTTIEPSPSGEATLAFVGDVHFERHLLRYLRPGGLRPVEPLWGDADLVIANLETAITSAGQHQEKIYNFRAPAKTVKALQQAGVGVVSMANNHALDYGRSGLADTLAAFSDASIAAVGIGADRAAALAPYRIDLNDRGGSGGVTPLSIFGVATSEMLSGLRWAAEPDRGGIVVWEAHRTALLRAIRC
jgi:poly-gamma-glutamate synthesis protein (capsule biosynthesis protein)